MAAQQVTLVDKDGNQLYPATNTSQVFNETGEKNLQQILEKLSKWDTWEE